MKYEIRVKGQLTGPRWRDWFADITVSAGDEGETVLTVDVPDQAALYGILARLRDLALPLLLVKRLDTDNN